MLFYGLDIGSTGCKCVAFAETGVQKALSYREYQTAAGQGDVDAEEIFACIEEVIGECTATLESEAAEVGAIAVTSFGETFVPIDREGNPLSSIVMYSDKRGQDETRMLIDQVGTDRIRQITRDNPDAMYSLPKMMWTMKHVPGVREHVWKLLQMTDYVCFRLSGECKVCETLACRTLAYDIEKRCWSDEMLTAAGIEKAWLPDPVPNGTVVGEILPDVAARTGLSTKVKIIAASQDQIAAATGAGVLDEGQAVDGTGTVECITPVFRGIVQNPEFTARNFVCVPHMTPGLYSTYAFNFAGGVTLKWFRDTFASSMKEEAKRRGISVYRMLDDTCPQEITDVLVVPHFLGAGGTPDLVATAKGTISGMTMQTGLPELYRATLEGLTFEMVYNLNLLASFGISIRSLRATGGGANSPVWLRIKSDIFGALTDVQSLEPLAAGEAGAAGCAMTAGVALGRFANFHEAASCFVVPGKTVYPDLSHRDVYREKYARWLKMREAALHLWEN